MLNLKKNIFNRKNLNYLLARVVQSSIPELQEKQEIINDWIKYIQSGNIYSTKETALQGKFLDDIFSKLLGYKDRIKNIETWNLNQEQTTTIDSKSADGSLGFFTKDNEDVRVVIELKNSNTNLDEKQHRHNDTRTPIEQAFSYQHKTGSQCKWIIVSNYEEIRLYHNSSSTEYEVFIITELGNWEQFRRFYYLLSFNNLINQSGESLIDSLYASNVIEERNISKEFYLTFKQIRVKLYEHLKEHNIGKPELLLLEKTQKVLDRLLFISFCEDNKLLPEKALKGIIEAGKKSYSISETKIWNELKGLFYVINVGSPPHNINKFNGGLFATDKELDELVIKDDILKDIAKLTEYDFESDVDVNILGHIFEQSISDIEEIKAGIEGKEFDKKTSKRKKEGIYYTPEYITKYIVENAIGGWLDDRKKELGFYELPDISKEDFQAIKKVKGKYQLNEKLQKHLDYWLAYKEKLMSIKVLDPACGSGAFLNQAFNFLYAEGQKVNDKISELSVGQTELFGLDKHILSNNLFGVDLNNESVEITKLSLWIKTANKHSELTALDMNIKSGNSLIDDYDVAGDKAFNWSKEFQEIMQNGGFDVVIGNPPYVVLSSFQDKEFHYLQNNYPTSYGRLNTFALFIERITRLLKTNSYSGLIIPDSLCLIDYYSNLRKYLLDKFSISKIIELGDGVFIDATVPSIIIIFSNPNQVDNQILLGEKNTILGNSIGENIKQSFYYSTPKYSFNLHINSIFVKLINSIDNSKIYKLKDIIQIKIGICTGANEKHISDLPIFNNSKKVLQGKDINRYDLRYSGKYINYNKEELLRARNEEIFLKPEKLLMRQTSDKLILTFDPDQYYTIDTLFILYPKVKNLDLKYTLAILNSKLLNWLYQKINPEAGRVFAQVKIDYVNELPFVMISSEEQKKFSVIVDKLLNLKIEYSVIIDEFVTFNQAKFTINHTSTKLQNWDNLSYNEFLSELTKAKINIPLEEQLSWQSLFTKQKALAQELKLKIDETEKKIDSMVYELYGLTDEEIRIVERG
ncbi:MAG: TaqI-like C-terminal specificity domain-containing protein [FCB group bacterium]|jgi:type I restriction-modification system DNA methylase subunit